jgi:hypothetical protein
MKNPLSKKFADKILVLEGRLNDKMGMILQERLTVESKINNNLMAKDKVHQDYY